MEILKDIYVPMRDGVHMAADIYRPEAPGRYPAILQRTPYLKAGNPAAGLSAEGIPAVSSVGAVTAGMLANVEALVDAGYVVVVSDTRGTGHSEGVYDYYNFEGGPYDGYDTVEWMAEQPWCDGNVGMMGASAGATLCYQAAITHPPHLKAMTANMQPIDYYLDQWFMGGVFRYENRIGWSTNMLSRLSPQDPGKPDSNNHAKKRDVYQQRYHQYYERMKAGKNPVNLDWLTEMFQHPTYDEFWKARDLTPRLKEIAIPVLHGGVLFDHFARGTVTAHEGIQTTKRLVMAAGALVPAANAAAGGFPDVQRRWFDHFLKGEENGVTAEPAARLYVMGHDKWVDTPGWPIPTKEASFYLAGGPGGGAGSKNDGLLIATPAAGSAPDTIEHDPVSPNRTPRNPHDQRRFEAGALTYSTAPLEQDLKVIGTPRLKLFASGDAKDVDWIVRLCDVAPDGRAQLLNVGALKGSHFASHAVPQPLQPGKVYEYDIEIWTVSNVFKKGHRIRVDLATSDFPFFESNPVPSRNEVFHDAERPSRLILPVAD